MGRKSVSESWKTRASALLRQARPGRDLPERLERIARALEGTAYLVNPLDGSATRKERLTIRLDGFDCVTFVESVLALARSRNRTDFVAELTRTRYACGLVAWERRLHYFIDWLRTNQRRGAIRIRTRGAGSRAVQAGLSVVAGLPARRVRFHVVPKAQLQRAHRRLGTGSIVAFASTRTGLDFFHTGLLFGGGAAGSVSGLCLIHAARSAGQVVAEPLGDFLRRNRMRGIAFAAPCNPSSDSGERP